jgi:hypothetical protein
MQKIISQGSDETANSQRQGSLKTIKGSFQSNTSNQSEDGEPRGGNQQDDRFKELRRMSAIARSIYDASEDTQEVKTYLEDLKS